MLHPLFIAKFVLDLLNREMKSFASKTIEHALTMISIKPNQIIEYALNHTGADDL